MQCDFFCKFVIEKNINMKSIVFTLLLLCGSCLSAQVIKSDSVLVHKSEVLPSEQYNKLLLDAGDCFKMSGYMQYAALGTGIAAGTLALIAGNKSGETRDNLYLVSGMVAGFSVVLEFASINYKIRGGRRLKWAAGINGTSLSFNF